eukprot:1161311-Pelagomonas_calceolata.AAC.24
MAAPVQLAWGMYLPHVAPFLHAPPPPPPPCPPHHKDHHLQIPGAAAYVVAAAAAAAAAAVPAKLILCWHLPQERAVAKLTAWKREAAGAEPPRIGASPFSEKAASRREGKTSSLFMTTMSHGLEEALTVTWAYKAKAI